MWVRYERQYLHSPSVYSQKNLLNFLTAFQFPVSIYSFEPTINQLFSSPWCSRIEALSHSNEIRTWPTGYAGDQLHDQS